MLGSRCSVLVLRRDRMRRYVSERFAVGKRRRRLLLARLDALSALPRDSPTFLRGVDASCCLRFSVVHTRRVCQR